MRPFPSLCVSVSDTTFLSSLLLFWVLVSSLNRGEGERTGKDGGQNWGSVGQGHKQILSKHPTSYHPPPQPERQRPGAENRTKHSRAHSHLHCPVPFTKPSSQVTSSLPGGTASASTTSILQIRNMKSRLEEITQGVEP